MSSLVAHGPFVQTLEVHPESQTRRDRGNGSQNLV